MVQMHCIFSGHFGSLGESNKRVDEATGWLASIKSRFFHACLTCMIPAWKTMKHSIRPECPLVIGAYITCTSSYYITNYKRYRVPWLMRMRRLETPFWSPRSQGDPNPSWESPSAFGNLGSCSHRRGNCQAVWCFCMLLCCFYPKSPYWRSLNRKLSKHTHTQSPTQI